MYYSGIDLHKDNSFITTLDVKGKIVKQERLVSCQKIQKIRIVIRV